MPGGLGFRCADAGQQVLLPQEPLAVGTTLTQLYRVRGIRSAAGDEELHAAGLLVWNVVRPDDERIWLARRIVVVRRRAGEAGEGQMRFPS